MKVEGGRLGTALELLERDGAAREHRQRAGEQRGPGHDRHPEDLVPAERQLEVRHRDVPDARLPLVELHDPGRLRPQLRGRVRAGVSLEEVDGDERGDDAREHDAQQEQRGQAEAQ